VTAGEIADDPRQVWLVPDQQHRTLIAGARQRVQRLARLEAPRQRLVQLEARALLPAHLRERQLGGFASTLLRARQRGGEAHRHARHRQSSDFGLPVAALGQAPFGVGACAVRLRVRVA